MAILIKSLREVKWEEEEENIGSAVLWGVAARELGRAPPPSYSSLLYPRPVARTVSNARMREEDLNFLGMLFEGIIH